jgi:uncharacterized protein YndB with AHSA1/START domain
MGLTQYTIERKFAASPAALYRAFTDPAVFAKWVWGLQAKNVQAEFDLRINGILRVTDDQGKGRHDLFRGIYLVIEPGQKLIHTIHWHGDVGYNGPGMKPLDEVLVVSFIPDGEGSLLRYLHMGIPDDGMSAKEHERSVRVTLDGLEKLLQTTQ